MAPQSQHYLIFFSLVTGLTLSSVEAKQIKNTTPKSEQVSGEVVLANQYHDGINLSNYWYSEKYDGIRALWTGKQLQTRQGNRINAPDWFIAQFPQKALDGELWAGRGQFNLVQNTVLDTFPSDQDWENILFMVFDMPNENGDYSQRYKVLQSVVRSNALNHLRLVEHLPIVSESELNQLLDNIEKRNGEGIMLRNKYSLYNEGRSDDLLKVKSYQDDEATVIGYKPGKGKYKGLTGSLLVKWQDDKTFYIGSGLSNQERKTPPPIGSTITFRYNGLTHHGLPRFARFSHLRKEKR